MSSARSKPEEGFDEILASDTSGPSLGSPGVSAQWHHLKNPSQTAPFRLGRGKKLLSFLLIKGNVSKNAGNSTLA